MKKGIFTIILTVVLITLSGIMLVGCENNPSQQGGHTWVVGNISVDSISIEKINTITSEIFSDEGISFTITVTTANIFIDALGFMELYDLYKFTHLLRVAILYAFPNSTVGDPYAWHNPDTLPN